MCGLAGWMGSMPDGPDRAQRMLARLAHRGPDARRVASWPSATLVHARLKVIDLTDNGDQPIGNEDGSVWVVFNGEITNHRELRRRLLARGHRFRGRSDTEVVPHLYEEHGVGFVDELRGMFAVAVYDRREHRLVLARDRFGIKPLFYAPGDRCVAFASEIGALREVPGAADGVDLQAVSDYAALFYIPAPATLFAGIRALEPGTRLDAQLERERVRWSIRRYHRWHVAPAREASLEDAVDRAEALLEQAVARQLDADVPLAALLSGGIDSSLVSAAAARRSPAGLDTFNVRFADRACDETAAAHAVAAHIGSRHETVSVGDAEGDWEHTADLLGHAGQPFADPSLFGVHAVCKAIRRRFTVALSGDGGDEVFGGYDVFWRLSRLIGVQRLPARVVDLAARGAAPLSRAGLVPAWTADRLRTLPGNDDAALVGSLVVGLPATARRELVDLGGDVLPVERLFASEWPSDAPGDRAERLSAHLTELLFRLTLPNDYLFKVDTYSMREALEVRVPMLDEELVAFGLTLPHRLKVAGRRGKLVLRAIAARALPRSVASKRKHGFGFPIEAWATRSFKADLRQALLGRSTPLRDVFRFETYRQWVEAFCDSRPEPALSRGVLARTVVMLLALHLALTTRPARLAAYA